MKVEIVGPAEVAAMVGLKTSTVYVMKSNGGLPEPDVKMAGGHPLWLRETIVKWAEENGRTVR